MSENTNERQDRYAEAIRNGLYDSCPNCGGNGWTVENQTWGQPEGEQVQCERCGYLNAGLNPRPGGEGLAASFIAGAVMAVADAEQAELRAELEMFKRGGKTLGETIEKQCQMVLDATGRHDLIAEDGDGDWGAVWDWLAELRPRAEAAEAERDRARSLAATLEAQLAQVEAAYARSVESMGKQQTVWTLAELQDDLCNALGHPEEWDEPDVPPVITGAHPYPICICLRCGPPHRDGDDWKSAPFGFASWMALCPTCGSKRCPGANDHRNHPALKADA